MLRLFATFGLFLCTAAALKAQSPAAVIPGDFADPSIIKKPAKVISPPALRPNGRHITPSILRRT
ncbi:hypothetical protein MKQ70_07825 [Chitinophaga sedimenti]|uniref:hypothetical protein n=1 Tax=Chitinophaga sedimenti TaxID=2033606 RepID=UPI0020052EBC|nr:hypothetical protein [Chitinophaga sedimenti]MCK7554917.1 hypothetical protein [Chitinophaga sedimenti]